MTVTLNEGASYSFAFTVRNTSTRGGSPVGVTLYLFYQVNVMGTWLVARTGFYQVFGAGQEISFGPIPFTVEWGLGGKSGAIDIVAQDPAIALEAAARNATGAIVVSASQIINVVSGDDWVGIPNPPGTPIEDINSQDLISIIYSRLPGSSNNYGNPTPVPLDQVPADVFPMAEILASRGTLPANLAWLLEPTIPSLPPPPGVTGGSLVKIISVVGETDSDGTPLPSSLVGTYWRANYPIAYGWFLLSRDGWMILLRRENFLLIDTSIYGPPGSAIPFTWFYAAGILPPQ